MGICVEKIPCKECGSSDGHQVFQDGEGEYNGYCFACGNVSSNPYEDKEQGYAPQRITKSPEEKAQALQDISEYVVSPLPARKLSLKTLDYFECHTSVSEEDGTTPTAVYFPYDIGGRLSAYKVRTLNEKRMYCLGEMKGVSLFGWQQAIQTGAKRLMITEGEFDAMALWQIIVDSNKGGPWEEYYPAVVSIPNGASGAVRTLTKLMPEIQQNFPEVVLAFDMDEPGQKAAEQLIRVFPFLLKAELPAKDANACLMEGRSKALKGAVVFKAHRPKNTRLVYGSSLAEAAKKKPEWGLSWPWPRLTEATRGIRRGETIYMGGGVKMGKSELLNAIASHIVTEHNLPIFLVKPEEAVVKTYQMLVGKVAGRIFHDPSIEFDGVAFDKAEVLVRDKAIIQDVYQFVGWDSVKEDIRYVVGEGVKDVFLDPITCFVNQYSSAEANEALVSIAAELSSMAKDLDFTAYTFCHLKAPDSGSHERGSPVFSNQFAGSRAMMRSCNYMIGIEGNKDPELEIEERNLRTLVILEDREFGITDRIPLYWDHRTGMFNPI